MEKSNADEPLDELEFKEILAGKGEIKKNLALMNEQNKPLEELVHPLTFSLDTKRHPDMKAVPVSAKISRDFEKLYDEVRK